MRLKTKYLVNNYLLPNFSNSIVSKLCTYAKYICSKLKNDFFPNGFFSYFFLEPILAYIDLVFLYNS